MEKLNIGIILGSTREGRLSPQVGNWVKQLADQRGDANYTILDIADYKLPLLVKRMGMRRVLLLGRRMSQHKTDSSSSFRNTTTQSQRHSRTRSIIYGSNGTIKQQGSSLRFCRWSSGGRTLAWHPR